MKIIIYVIIWWHRLSFNIILVPKRVPWNLFVWLHDLVFIVFRFLYLFQFPGGIPPGMSMPPGLNPGGPRIDMPPNGGMPPHNPRDHPGQGMNNDKVHHKVRLEALSQYSWASGHEQSSLISNLWFSTTCLLMQDIFFF